MNRTLATECKNKVGKPVLLKGWMNQLRELGKINFLILRDRSGYIQLVIEDKKELEKVSKYYVGTVIEVEGEVQESKQAELGVEIIKPKITVLNPVEEAPPVEYNKDEIQAELPTILNYRPITLRNRKIQAVFKVQATVLEAFREALRSKDFVEFRNPVLMKTPSESGADVFEVKYFDGKAYLAQSPQFYKQMMVGVFERVFTISPVFRAEKHHTNRHLTELTHMDGEMGFVTSLDEVLEVIEYVVRHIFEKVNEKNADELKLWNVTTPKLPDGKFPRVKVKEAFEMLQKRTGKSPDRKLDPEPEDERGICKWAMEEYNSDVIWLTHYYKNKNLYTQNEGEFSLSYDLLCRGIEWLTGTIRIHEYKKLVEGMKKEGFDLKNYEGYLQAFKYGMPPEAGFSFGLERITQKIFDFDNVREATLFPRDVERLAP
ncbi:MAG: aspartate--tRNA(Asn) ligase [Patescibacteria group bacterium]|nr:aspartate--tRNA(Asn) ligase [Patescibacteria group bacterium]